MYVRRDRKQSRAGQERTYISLAHNVWETVGDKKRAKPIVFSRLGVEEELDMGTVCSMRSALDRYLLKRFGPEALRQAQAADGAVPTAGGAAERIVAAAEELRPQLAPLRFLLTVEFGLRAIVEPVWEQLGLKEVLQGFAAEHRIRFDFERVIFGMVLNRLVDPLSKLACNDWLKDRAYFPEGRDWHVRQFYQSLDLLHQHAEELDRAIRRGLRLRMKPEELELLLLDTTSSYFESDLDDVERAAVEADWQAHDRGERPEPPLTPRPQVINDPPVRMRGHSKDHRANSPQVVVATVCAKNGVILAHQTFPGNTADPSVTLTMLAEAAKAEPGQPDSRKVVVFDSGMGGEAKAAALDALPAPPDRISAVPLRNNKFGREEVIGRVGRYRQHPTKPNLKLRTVHVPADQSPSGRAELWIATRNHKDRERQHRKIERHVQQVEAVLAKDDRAEGHGQQLQELLAHRTQKGYLTLSKDGTRYLLSQERVRQEKLLAGMHLLRTTLVDRDPVEILDAYQALLTVEENFRIFKGPLKLRPMHHRLGRRIEAHVTLCVLALVVLRELELRTGLNHRKLVELFGPIKATLTEQGQTRFWQRNEWPEQATQVLDALRIDPGPVTWGATRVEPDGS